MLQRRGSTLFAVLLAACAADPSTDARVGTTREAILGGTASGDDQDDVVMLIQVDPVAMRRIGICTAALLAPKLVLTARHCVANVDDALLSCNADGTPVVGGGISGDLDPTHLFVFTGKDRPALIGVQPPELNLLNWKPAGKAVQVIDDASKTLCNHDLALLLLEDPIENAPLATLRLDGNVAANEKLLTIGWGVSSDEVEPKQRQQRSGVNVTRVGPDGDIPTLTPNEFLFDESVCLGDSGGPIFSQTTNAIVGVVSRGGNGEDPSQGSPASTCVQADNIGTKLAPFKDVVMNGFKLAGAEPKLEPKPDDGGCTVASPPSKGGSFAGAIALAMCAAVLARRRTRR